MEITTQAISDKESFNSDADLFLRYAEQIYPNSSKLFEIREIVKSWKRKSEEIYTNRGVNNITIGFVGDKDAGKSFLLHSLIKDPKVKEQIVSGFGTEGRTEKLVWIGQERPHNFNSQEESFISINDPEKQFYIQENVTLVDIPGFNDALSSAAEIAREKAVTNCQILLFVLDESTLEAERTQKYIQYLKGRPVLSVINRISEYNDEEHKNALRQQLYNTWTRLGTSQQEQTLLIPHFKYENHSTTPEEIRTQLLESLSRLIRQEKSSPTSKQELLNRIQNEHIQQLAELLEEDYNEVNHCLVQTLDQVQNIPSALTGLVLGREEKRKEKLKVHVRGRFAQRTPGVFFPLKPFLGVIAMTSSVWDALILMCMGSFLSSFKLLGGSLKNIVMFWKKPEIVENDIVSRARSLILNQHHKNLKSLGEHLDRLSNRVSQGVRPPSPDISGLELLKEEAENICEKTLSNYRPNSLLYITGILSLIIIAWILVGPIKASYWPHLQLVWESTVNAQPIDWHAFSTPTLGNWFSWILFAFAPVGVIAFILQLWIARDSVINKLSKKIEDGVRNKCTTLSENKMISTTFRDPRIHALKYLFDQITPFLKTP